MKSTVLEKIVEHLDESLRTLDHRTPKHASDERIAWRMQIINALAHLNETGMFEQKDSLGHLMSESLLAVASGNLWDPFVNDPGRARLLGELVLNLDEPKRINQGLKGTCGAACVEGYVAERDPAEYARIIAGLVSREGQATLRTGATLTCDEDVLIPNPFERRRNPVSRIFQAACMEFAYPNMDYDNLVDGHFDGDVNMGSGLELDAFDRLLEAVTGVEWQTVSIEDSKIARMLAKLGLDAKRVVEIKADGLSIIDQSTAKGEHVFVSLELPSLPNPIPDGVPPTLYNMAHKVRALRIDWAERSIHYDDPMDPERRWFDGADVRIIDTFGHCSMPIDDFLRLMTELSYRPEFWTRPTVGSA